MFNKLSISRFRYLYEKENIFYKYKESSIINSKECLFRKPYYNIKLKKFLCLGFINAEYSKDKIVLIDNIACKSRLLNNSEMNNFLVIHYQYMKGFYDKIKHSMFNLNAGYYRKFAVIGYNYRVKTFKKRRYLMLKIGYSYRIIIKIPNLLKICPRKRTFTIVGTNKIIFDSFVNYIRNLRNLYPYKRKGFAYRNERFRLKKGKKTRFR